MAAQSSFLLRSENIQSIARFAVMKPLLTYGALLDGPRCDLGPRSKVEFGQDVLDVISGGLFADDERLVRCRDWSGLWRSTRLLATRGMTGRR
jgi:hypothetical protein